MNIKNEEAHRLAKELAEITGESVTAAVTVALKERLERVGRARSERQDELVERLLAIGRDFRAHLKPECRDVDVAIIDTMLYDERGLPK